MELVTGLGHLGHVIGRHSVRGATNSARRLHYAGRIAREAGNYASDVTVEGLALGGPLVPGFLGVEAYSALANWRNRRLGVLPPGVAGPLIAGAAGNLGRRWPVPDHARWGINGNIWSRVLPTWHQPEYPPDPDVFDPNYRHKDLLTRTPQQWGEWNTWISERMLQVASDISSEIRYQTTDGQIMAADSTNSTYSPLMSKIFRAIPHRGRVTAVARNLQDIPTPEEWRTYRTALIRHLPNREEAKEYAAAHGLDTKRWHIIEESIATTTDPNLLNVYNSVNIAQSVIDLTQYRINRGTARLQVHIAQGMANDPAGYEPLNAEMQRAVDAAIANPAKALKDADNLEKLQRQMIDHVFSVVGMNLTNILQRHFEAQEIYHVKKFLLHCLYKDLWEYARYGYMGNTSHKGVWQEVYDKAFARLGALLVEIDPIHSRKQITPIAQ